MFSKPFRPPSFVRQPLTSRPLDKIHPPEAKRRRISDENARHHGAGRSLDSPPRPGRRPEPLQPCDDQNRSNATHMPEPSEDGAEQYYLVLWRKPTNKKNKTWDGDGVLLVRRGIASLVDVSGKKLGSTTWSKPLLTGSTLFIEGKEIEVDSLISKEEALSKYSKLVSRPVQEAPRMIPSLAKNDDRDSPKLNANAKSRQQKISSRQVSNVNVAAKSSRKTQSSFKSHREPTADGALQHDSTSPVPRHNPLQEGALVMKKSQHVPKGKRIVDVVVDPILVRHLRPHQRDGVAFLYECVMGMRDHGGEGAILADEMGLGKTLQTIALLWTLLKQNPIYDDQPVIKKALIVCPVSLIINWRKEFRKWLGNERLGVFVMDDKHKRLTDFTMGKCYSVMIIGYEKLRLVQEDLKKGTGIDIVVADEGHRLKTAQNKSAMAIKSLNTERRIILSGTPIQNDLSEFYTMVDFVNPGLLGKYTVFRRQYEGPIIKSRQPEATQTDIEDGEAKSGELVKLTSQFILRRTAEILSGYLPPKTEFVLLCKPTAAQASVYKNILSSPLFNAALGNSETALQLINILIKVCNSPSLLRAAKDSEDDPTKLLPSLLSQIPNGSVLSPGTSSKIRVLDDLLYRLRSKTDEKVVIVSHYTSTLDIIARLLTANSYAFQRLDGSTPASKRQQLVDTFNRASAASCFAFLLSAKSGGFGLNLIGASRLILFDVDWNPATDDQAMARIHRDGQKRPCRIYRLLTKGALDEKIYQRQLTKRGLADALVDNKANASTFTREELRNLFTLDERPDCQTHTLLGCTCGGLGTSNVNHEDPADAAAETRDPTPNNTTDTAAKSDNDVDSDDSLVLDYPILRRASTVNMEEQERQIRDAAAAKLTKKRNGTSNGSRGGPPKMRELMHYAHVDVERVASELQSLNQKRVQDDGEEDEEEEEKEGPDLAPGLQTLLEDDMLAEMLGGKGESAVKFLFCKRT